MSRRVDSNLVNVVRKWGSELMFDKRLLSHFAEQKEAFYKVMLRYLLSIGCKPIGRDRQYDEIYMECNGELISLSVESEYWDALREVLGEIEQLSEARTQQLRDNLPSASTSLVGIDNFTVYGKEPVLLTTVEGIPLYLGEVDILHSVRDSIRIHIVVNSVTSAGEMDFMRIDYDVSASGLVHRSKPALGRSGVSLLGKYAGREKEEKMQAFETTTLMALNEKYLTIEYLLRRLHEFISGSSKAVITLLLY